ncbi:hypothetical protein MSAN_02459300 [Mycena sanguinolenta]|uniref:Uncharacterized protein n=1 Tax=Mycena sanguinolenta TaxID=230812 RepID=A0A8H6WXQ8_9AGAR|nr:hypothetical protein MSAN_02459300 [Mycena sanguinolenta]
MSPHKSARGANSSDVTYNPHIRTESERPSPGPNRKVSQGSSAHQSRSGTPRTSDVFNVGNPTPDRNAGNYILGTAPQPRSHTGHSEPGSPSPSSRGGLDTGHHATDIESGEEGEIRENGELYGDEDDTMPFATAAQDVDTAAGTTAEPMAVDSEDEEERREQGENPTGQGAARATPNAAAARAPTPRTILDGERVEFGGGHEHPFVFQNAALAEAHARPLPPYEPRQQAPRPTFQAPQPVPQAPQPGASAPFFRGPAQAMVAAAVGATGIRAVDAAGALGVSVAAADAALTAFANGAVGVAFAFPDLLEHVRAHPTHRDENPHREGPAAPMPDPAGPEDVNITRFQPNVGKFQRPVMSWDRLTDNVHDDHKALFSEQPDTHLFAVPFNGGSRMHRMLADPKNNNDSDSVIVAALEKAIASLVNPVTTTVFPVCEAKEPEGGNYAGPIVVGIYITNREDRIRLIDQMLIAIDRTFAFYIVAPEHTTLAWLLTIVTTSIGGGTSGAAQALRAALSKFIWTNTAIGIALEQLTHATDRSPLNARRYKISQTIDCVWDEASRDYTVYMKPCTSDAAQWRNFTVIVQHEKFQHAHYTFTSKINPAKERPGPRCVSCKNEDHYQPGCKTIRDPDFWGPTTQLKDATEGLLAQTNNGGGGGRGRGNARGQARGTSRGRSRGRGGN